MLVSDRSSRLTVRIAPYRDAIHEARRVGLTWADLARIFGVRADRLRWAALNCDRYASEAAQLPLPESVAPMPSPPEPAAAAPAVAASPTPSAPANGATQGTAKTQGTKEFLASLQQIRGKQ